MTTWRFPFEFDPAYAVAAAIFGVSPRSSGVVVDEEQLDAWFGPWRVRTPLGNVAGAEVTGPYSFPKTAGPARLSFRDRGLTFATNGRRGVCVRFHRPVPGIEPTGRLRHPGLTVTVADCAGLVAALTDRAAASAGADEGVDQ